MIHKGQAIGSLTDPFGEFKEEITSPYDGYLVGINNNPVVHAGDALFHVGMDILCRIDTNGDD